MTFKSAYQQRQRHGMPQPAAPRSSSPFILAAVSLPSIPATEQPDELHQLVREFTALQDARVSLEQARSCAVSVLDFVADALKVAPLRCADLAQHNIRRDVETITLYLDYLLERLSQE